jgi:4-diphosphocytidyl-2-C-methyl-D-erythritol kinase
MQVSKTKSSALSSLSSTKVSHTALSYAKVNLGLEVLRKRTDGFHDINTIFARIALHDRITFSSAPEDRGIIVECTPSLDISQEENLVWKVARHLYVYCAQHNIGMLSGMHIRIQKQIPTGGGLGGGSSNAGLTLRTLAQCWGIDDAALLQQIGSQYGSDIPFFLLDTSFAHGTSRGEILAPLAHHPKWHQTYALLLCFPGIHVSTPWAYKAINRTGEHQPTDIAALINAPDVLLQTMQNDFELPVYAEHPQLLAIQNTLEKLGAVRAWMSGSGSTMVGVFGNESDAHRAGDDIATRYSINTQVTKFL